MRQAETVLRVTNPAGGVGNRRNAQLDSLRISQCIMVGRAVILAETMLPLPSRRELQPELEVGRFNWLLHGTRFTGLEIHGGCVFSRRLLHLISQIIYSAARLRQEPQSPVVPVTTEYILKELATMNQWSSGPGDSAPGVPGYPITPWIRTLPRSYIVHSSKEMTEVTAEAWRLAAMIYLQCRLLRCILPPSASRCVGLTGTHLDCLAMILKSSPIWTHWRHAFASYQLQAHISLLKRRYSPSFCSGWWRLSVVIKLWRRSGSKA